MATEEQIAAINKAMERFQGDRDNAAIELQMTRRQLNDLILNDDLLRERWGTAAMNVPPPAPLSDTQALVRPPLPPLSDPLPMQQKITEEEQKKIQTAMHSMGLDGDVIAQSMSYMNFAHDHYLPSIHMLHGGLVQTSMLMHDEYARKLKRQRDLELKLDDFDTYPLGDSKRVSLSIEFDNISKQLRELNAQIISAKKVAENGVIQMALVRKGMDKKEKRIKPKQAGNSEVL